MCTSRTYFFISFIQVSSVHRLRHEYEKNCVKRQKVSDFVRRIRTDRYRSSMRTCINVYQTTIYLCHRQILYFQCLLRRRENVLRRIKSNAKTRCDIFRPCAVFVAVKHGLWHVQRAPLGHRLRDQHNALKCELFVRVLNLQLFVSFK